MNKNKIIIGCTIFISGAILYYSYKKHKIIKRESLNIVINQPEIPKDSHPVVINQPEIPKDSQPIVINQPEIPKDSHPIVINQQIIKDNPQGRSQKAYLKLKKAQKRIEEQKIRKIKEREKQRRKENKTMPKNYMLTKITPTYQPPPFNSGNNELDDHDPIIIMSKK